MRKITKLFSNQSIKTIDEEKRQAKYIISTDDVDRMGEVVEQSWDLKNYEANPIVLFGHDPSKPENVLGKALEITTEKDGDRSITSALVQFAEAGTSKGVDTVWSLVKQGILKTVSVGFIPHTYKNTDTEDTPTVLSDNELLEFSIVPIPANPQAIALAVADESISEKDAKWLIKQYETETAYLKKSIYDIMTKNNDSEKSNKGDKQMSDEEITKLAEALGTAVAEAINPKLEEILKAVNGDEEAPANEGDGQGAGDGTDETEPKKSAKSEQVDDGGADDEGEADAEVTDEAEVEKLLAEAIEKELESK